MKRGVDDAGRTFIEVAGLRVYVGTEAECAEASFAICGPVSHFTDDVHTTCASCGTPVVHRPYAPAQVIKVCMACALVIMAGSERPS